jgi:hypothetical protein
LAFISSLLPPTILKSGSHAMEMTPELSTFEVADGLVVNPSASATRAVTPYVATVAAMDAAVPLLDA